MDYLRCFTDLNLRKRVKFVALVMGPRNGLNLGEKMDWVKMLRETS